MHGRVFKLHPLADVGLHAQRQADRQQRRQPDRQRADNALDAFLPDGLFNRGHQAGHVQAQHHNGGMLRQVVPVVDAFDLIDGPDCSEVATVSRLRLEVGAILCGLQADGFFEVAAARQHFTTVADDHHHILTAARELFQSPVEVVG